MQILDINSSDIRDGLSPESYREEYYRLTELIKSHNFYNLDQLVYYITDGSHKTPDYKEDGVKFLMVTNLTKGFDIDFENVKYIDKEFDQTLKHCKPKQGDILFSKVGTVGIAKLVPEDVPDCNIFVSLAILKGIFKDIVLPEYLTIYLNSGFTRWQIDRVVKGIGVPDLHLEDISRLKVIVPSLDKQREIVEFYSLVENKLKRNEEKLAHIDLEINYILQNELKYKSIQDNKDLFITDSSEILDRIDPPHVKKFNIIDNFNNNRIQFKSLEEISYNISSGQRPKGGVNNIKKGIPSLGGEHIGKYGEIVYDDMKFIPIEFENSFRFNRIKTNDILICKDGAKTGKVGFVDNNFKYDIANINEHIFKVTLLDGYSPKYVFSILHSFIGQQQLKRKVTGGAQGGITLDVLKDIYIPFFDDKSQEKEVESYVFKQRYKMFKLMEKISLEKLKMYKLVEKMIIGKIDYEDATKKLTDYLD